MNLKFYKGLISRIPGSGRSVDKDDTVQEEFQKVGIIKFYCPELISGSYDENLQPGVTEGVEIEPIEYPLGALPKFPIVGDGYGVFYMPLPEQELNMVNLHSIVSDELLGKLFGQTEFYWESVGYYDEEINTIPPEFKVNYPYRWGFKSPTGHLIIFDNKTGEFIFRKLSDRVGNNGGDNFELTMNDDETKITQMGLSLSFSKSGLNLEFKGNKIECTPDGTKLTYEGNEISMGKLETKVSAKQNLILEGLNWTQFLLSYASHTHSTAVGPSTPPVPPFVPSTFMWK